MKVNFIKLLFNKNFGHYSHNESSNIKMTMLGLFLTDDIGCIDINLSSFRDWAIDDSLGYCVCGNITCLEKNGETILLSDLDEEDDTSNILEISRQQFVQLLDDWNNKVCKLKPQEVIIKHENGEFTIETGN